MMDADQIPRFTWFQVLDDFNAQSANGSTCYISNLPKQKAELGKQPHEVDPFILRAGEISFEGYLDVRPQVILDTAREMGYLSGEEVEEIVRERAEAEAAVLTEEYARQEKKLQDQIDMLVELLNSQEENFPEADDLTEYLGTNT